MTASLNLFSNMVYLLSTVRKEVKESNRMIDKIMNIENQQIGNIIRNNDEIIKSLDLVITELRKQILEKNLKRLVEDF